MRILTGVLLFQSGQVRSLRETIRDFGEGFGDFETKRKERNAQQPTGKRKKTDSLTASFVLQPLSGLPSDVFPLPPREFASRFGYT